MQEERSRNVQIAQHYKMRYYENEFPVEGELVLGQSLKSEENGCYVALLEYNDRNGMMPINEYTTTMRKAIHRAMKVGKKEILRVIRVDREKGYIDLSKKQVNVDDEQEGERKYNNSTQLHSILIHIAELCKVPILSLYEKYIWPLYKTGKYDHPLSFLKQMLVYEEKQEELGIEDEKIKKCLLDELKRRFKRPVIKTMANFSVSCRSIKGITAIKHALHSGIEAAKEKGFEVKIFIIGAPKYTCEVSSATVESGREALTYALHAIEKVMKEERGDYSLDKQPYIVGDTSQHIKDMIKGEEVQQVVDDDDSDMGEADD